MDQFGRIGEVMGSMKALMVFSESIQINQRQCCLLLDMFSFAYDSIAEEMRQNLRFEERHMKWKIIEQPLKELHRIFKEGETYIRQCLEIKDWWAKAITLYQNTDCVEFYIHNLLSCIPIVIEAIETAAEFSGWDHDLMQKKKLVYSSKYKKEWKDQKLFQWKFGKQYLIVPEFCCRIDTVWKEDRWILFNKIQQKKISGSTKQEQRLIEVLFNNLDSSGSLSGKLLPSRILIKSEDYQVRRRLGSGSQYKEILWLGESFALRHFFGDIEPLVPEISSLLSLSHPNIMHFLCGFTDEERKECFLVMELMSRDLCSYIKEICSPKKRIPFSLPVSVDLMLQIARGMEYLHSMKIYHGDLNPSNILLKPRSVSTEGYLHAKVSGFGLSSVKNFSPRSPSSPGGTSHPFIWHAPEVLEEKDQTGRATNSKYREKSDVYSFGMICFEILTGKVPFEDAHLQGDKMSRNIRAGERPLFPFHSPKYVTNLTKRCWQKDPNQRPSFSSICRILRYIKRFIVKNPHYNSQPDPPTPSVDYSDIESRLLRKFPSWDTHSLLPMSEIPFQMFVYRVLEKEKTVASLKESSESESERTYVSGDENVTPPEIPSTPVNERKCLPSPESMNKKLTIVKKSSESKVIKQTGTPKGRAVRPPQLTPCGRSLRISDGQLMSTSPRMKRTSSGHDVSFYRLCGRNLRMSSEGQLISPRMQRTSAGHVSDSELS